MAVDLAASAAVAAEDVGCTPTWRTALPLPSLRVLHLSRTMERLRYLLRKQQKEDMAANVEQTANVTLATVERLKYLLLY